MKSGFRFAEHAWISLIVFWLAAAVLLLVFAIAGTRTSAVGAGTGFLLATFVVAPFVMRIPRVEPGTRGLFGYCREWLDKIRLTRVRPLVPLILLGLSCWVILGLSQALGTLTFRLTEGKPLTAEFVLATLSIAGELPPRSTSLYTSFGSVLEEVAWRGIFLSLFLDLFSKRKALVMAALGFSVLHLLNLLNPGATVWGLAQLAWTFLLGLWYGYAVLKTDSLIVPMLVHWLGNAFIYSFTGYIQENAGAPAQALYSTIFGLGLVPMALLMLWVRFVTARWKVFREVEG